MKMLQVATKQAIKKQCDISYAIHDHSEVVIGFYILAYVSNM